MFCEKYEIFISSFIDFAIIITTFVLLLPYQINGHAYKGKNNMKYQTNMQLTIDEQKRLRKIGAWRAIAEVTGSTPQYVAQTTRRGVGKNPTVKRVVIINAAKGLLAFVEKSKKTANPFDAFFQNEATPQRSQRTDKAGL